MSEGRVDICPVCEGAVDVGEMADGAQVACPHCGNGFVVGGYGAREDAAAEESAKRRHDEELSGTRIKLVSKNRRAAVRARSWQLIGMIACVVVAIQLALEAMRERRGRRDYEAGRVAGVLVCSALAVHFARSALAMTREIRQSALDVAHAEHCVRCGHDLGGMGVEGNCPACGAAFRRPSNEPNFAGLSDGTQHARRLEEMDG